MGQETLIVFTRYPGAGTTKTRLIPALGPEGAAALQCKMAEWVMACARETGVRIEVRHEGGTLQQMQDWLGSDITYKPQGQGHRGQRMAHAFAERILSGDHRVILTSTDCPDITSEIFKNALKHLETHDIVFGPDRDGGYYLIGLSRGIPEIFEDIEWDSRRELSQSLRVARAAERSVSFVADLHGIDTPQDLPLAPSRLRPLPGLPLPTISVIIPTLNNVKHLGLVLDRAQTGEDVEIIIVDGGSTDGTLDIAKEHNVRAIDCRRGRSIQMNFGAKEAMGEILIFLRADTLLPARYDDYARVILADSGNALGAFEFRVDSDRTALCLIEQMVNWRSKTMHMPHGEQALFMRKTLFVKLGGYLDQPVLADHELVRRLRREGSVVTANAAVVIPAHRWEQLGVFRTAVIDQLALTGYHLRVPPDKLARLYRGRD